MIKYSHINTINVLKTLKFMYKRRNVHHEERILLRMCEKSTKHNLIIGYGRNTLAINRINGRGR